MLNNRYFLKVTAEFCLKAVRNLFHEDMSLQASGWAGRKIPTSLLQAPFKPVRFPLGLPKKHRIFWLGRKLPVLTESTKGPNFI
jgi:hypothetical protein